MLMCELYKRALTCHVDVCMFNYMNLTNLQVSLQATHSFFINFNFIWPPDGRSLLQGTDRTWEEPATGNRQNMGGACYREQTEHGRSLLQGTDRTWEEPATGNRQNMGGACYREQTEHGRSLLQGTDRTWEEPATGNRQNMKHSQLMTGFQTNLHYT